MLTLDMGCNVLYYKEYKMHIDRLNVIDVHLLLLIICIKLSNKLCT